MKCVLSIAGSDSSGGAGIQADIKTIQAHRLFAETAITAITVQNTKGVFAVQDISPEIVSQQIDAVFDDIRPDAVKIGMVSSAEIVHAIASALSRNSAENIVVDPVMVATSGSTLIATDAIDALVREVMPMASVITPNIPEATVLSGIDISNKADMEKASDSIAGKLGEICNSVPAILVKGGHSDSDSHAIDDLLRLPDGKKVWFSGKRIDNPNTHGTGCTLSSAIACGLASGLTIEEAVRKAKDYVTGALVAQLNLGSGRGPLNHMWEYM